MKFLHLLCCLMVFSAGIFGQNLQADLKKTFHRFSVVKINQQEALLKAKSGVPFKIQTEEITFEFVLTKNDMRSADYKSEYTDKDGRKTIPNDIEVITYKGKLTGQADSIVRISLDGQRIEGFISTQDRQDYFIELATNYSSKAMSGEVVIFQAKDRVKNPIINFGLDGIVAQIKGGVNKQAQAQFVKAGFTPFAGSAQTTMKSIKIATDADRGFVLANGGLNNSIRKIRAALSTVDGIYERDLNYSITIGYAHYWKTTDPYGNLRGGDLLNTFRDYWNTNYPQISFSRNVANLFSDNYEAPSYGGLTYLGGPICNTPSLAYSVTYLPNTGNTNLYSAVVAHEIGQNLGGQYTDGEPSCAGTLMQSVVRPEYNAFCEYSITQITTFFRQFGPFYDATTQQEFLCDPTLAQPLPKVILTNRKT